MDHADLSDDPALRRQCSQRPCVDADRTQENLCTTDNAIIMARQRLLRSAAAHEEGVEPPGLAARCHAVRSASFVLPEGELFHKAKAAALVAREGVAHTSI